MPMGNIIRRRYTRHMINGLPGQWTELCPYKLSQIHHHLINILFWSSWLQWPTLGMWKFVLLYFQPPLSYLLYFYHHWVVLVYQALLQKRNKFTEGRKWGRHHNKSSCKLKIKSYMNQTVLQNICTLDEIQHVPGDAGTAAPASVAFATGNSSFSSSSFLPEEKQGKQLIFYKLAVATRKKKMYK